jgi:hypothetical protein
MRNLNPVLTEKFVKPFLIEPFYFNNLIVEFCNLCNGMAGQQMHFEQFINTTITGKWPEIQK